MSKENQKDFANLSIYNNNNNNYSLLKIFNYIKKNIIKKKKKISSNDIDDLREQHSDNESDKTFYEKNCPSNSSRKTNSVISNKSNQSNKSNKSNQSNKSTNTDNSGPITKYTSKTLYRKRIKSIDYVRDNDDDEYNVVMSYQKYIPKRTVSGGARFDANRIKKNST
jgi:hypothetical protein